MYSRETGCSFASTPLSCTKFSRPILTHQPPFDHPFTARETLLLVTFISLLRSPLGHDLLHVQTHLWSPFWTALAPLRLSFLDRTHTLPITVFLSAPPSCVMPKKNKKGGTCPSFFMFRSALPLHCAATKKRQGDDLF